MTRIEPLSEDQLLSAILELAARTGWLAYHVRNSRAGVIQGDVGFPDLVLARGGSIVFAELKAGKLNPGPAQMRWLETLALAGTAGRVRVCIWRPADWTSGMIEADLR